MSIRGLADRVKITLRTGQDRHVETIEWLLDQSDANQAEGRTTLLALGFINVAMRDRGQKVYFFDHLMYEGSGKIMESVLKNFLKQIGFDDDFEVTKKYILRKR